MASKKRVRWDCPNGKHPGVLGPSRPRQDNIVRYCLPCSEAAGRLVERTAPALERQRQATAERAAETAKAKRRREAARRQAAKERETERFTVEGVDLRDEMRRLARLRAFGGARGKLARQLPEFTVSRRSSEPQSRYGTAWPWEWRIHMALWPGLSLTDARETLVHELTHLHVGSDRSDTHRWHGEQFRDTMRRAFREAYGPDVINLGSVNNGRYAAALRRQERSKTANRERTP